MTTSDDEITEQINEDSYEELAGVKPKIIAKCIKCHKEILSNESYVIKSVMFFNTNSSARNTTAYFHNKKPCWG